MNLNRCNQRPIQHNQDPSTWPTTEELQLERTEAFTGWQESEAKNKDEWASDSASITGHLEQRT
ncbi:MAG: hypothetical protein ACF8AM_08930 [Rhodopirellula sp. JB055]|uniref:hypothetical protein n=1 Tax=Rhodopirellula sp. JB055 TaxID=3342846 RepID=UPI00370B1E5E